MLIGRVIGAGFLVALSFGVQAEARGGRSAYGGPLVRVSGYVNSRGTYVAPYYRTPRDGILSNNLSYRGGASSYGSVGGSAVYGYRSGVSYGNRSVLDGAGSGQIVGTSGTVPEPVNAPLSCEKEKTVGSGAGFCILN